MAPKRSAAQLQALADDPVGGWSQTPMAVRVHQGVLSAPYLMAFLHRHEIPVNKESMERLNGSRLWRSGQTLVPAEQWSGSDINANGILSAIRISNHGFAAPTEMQDKFVVFLGAQPIDLFSDIAKQVSDHYQVCRGFRCGEQDLGSPPSFLDLFKDDRIPKMWRTDGALSAVLINANGTLRTWVDLMQPGWNPQNSPRDAASYWKICQGDVESLHDAMDAEGA